MSADYIRFGINKLVSLTVFFQRHSFKTQLPFCLFKSTFWYLHILEKMRFSVAAIGALAAGAVATSQSFTTEVVYDTETYCPESSTAAPVQSTTPTYSPEV